MKALVLKSYNNLIYEDVPEPTIGDQDVLVKVKACGICGSDIHGMDGSSGRRIPPIVMGHEAAGLVARVGKDVKDAKEGDRVTFDSTLFCGECFYCMQGQINLCDRRRVLGVSCDEYRQNGAFAEYAAIPSRILYPLPPELTFHRAAMVEPVSIAFHAVNLTPIVLNETAVVVGAGMIGLLVIQTLRAAGCGKIIAVDIEQDKLDLAVRFGADFTLKAGSADIPAEVLRITGGRGADIAIDAVGKSVSLDTALSSLKKGGSLTVIGNLDPKVDLPLQKLVTRQITLRGSCASSGEYPACLEMIARGVIDVDVLISRVAPLSEGAGWFERLYKGEEGLMKIILEP